MRETSTLPDGVVLGYVHPRAGCVGTCVIHQPTDHHMRWFRLLWRDDRKLFERICPHGVGHPDPDQWEFWERTDRSYESVHGCDGCCYPQLNTGDICTA